MLNQLRKCLESEKEDKWIFDIIVYGSTVKGKGAPNDLDLVVIFLQGTLRERLDRLQEIKAKLKNIRVQIDIKQMLLQEFFSTEFLAKTGILLEGISVFKCKKISEMMGFKPYALFWYDLKPLNHNQKVKFNYILAGRRTMDGVLKRLHAVRLNSGTIKVEIENSAEFEEILKSNNVNYRKKEIFEVI